MLLPLPFKKKEKRSSHKMQNIIEKRCNIFSIRIIRLEKGGFYSILQVIHIIKSFSSSKKKKEYMIYNIFSLKIFSIEIITHIKIILPNGALNFI